MSIAISVSAYAHQHHHLSKEELIALVVKQEIALEKKERINAQQHECIICLEQELDHIKHKLHEKHRYHALKKALHELLIF